MVKNFLFKLKIFVWYLITGPLKYVLKLLKMIFKGFSKGNSDHDWIAIYLLFFLVAIFSNNRIGQLSCLGVILFLWIRNEWKSGKFMHEWRETKYKNLRKGGKK